MVERKRTFQIKKSYSSSDKSVTDKFTSYIFLRVIGQVSKINMVSKFNKNAIINGYIDYFCLVCESYFSSEEAVERHMEKQIHKENLESTPYLEKYEVECIRKVPSGYFCEYCNLLLSTGTKVNFHVEEMRHQDNKRIALLRYAQNDVLAFNDVLIKEEAWHGFTGDACAICNCDTDNFAEHKLKNNHIIKLVQDKIQFGADNNLYRKVDDSTFQCLTCNKIFATRAIDQHFNDSEHQKNYNSCIINNVTDKKTNNETTRVEKKLVDDDASTKCNILDSIRKFQENEIKIHFESETAFCKKCYVDVSFDYNEIKKHIAEHKNILFSTLSTGAGVEENHKITEMQKNIKNELSEDLKDVTHDQSESDEEYVDINEEESDASLSSEISDVQQIDEPDSEFETFADENNISYIAGNSYANCTACDIELPASLKKWKEHLNGSMHKAKLNPVKVPNSGAHLPKKPMLEFVKEVIHIEGVCGCDVVVNDKYCLTAKSFVLIKEENSKLRCLYCDTILEDDDIKLHLRNPGHDEALERASVVLQDNIEFVREIRTGIYHCGYCHLIVGDWSDFEQHAEEEDHKQRKKTMLHRLAGHGSEIKEQRKQQQLIVWAYIMKYRLGLT